MSVALDTSVDIADRARNLIRDFPLFFEETYQPLSGSTVKLSRMLVATLEIRKLSDGTEVTAYALDPRNGVVKFTDPSTFLSGISIIGYHYEWFLPDDLEYFADISMSEVMSGRTDVRDFAELSHEEKHVTAIGAVSFALMSLLTELSTDIDVSTPEGLSIPAHMRFQQVQQMQQFWAAEYTKKSAMLNLGLERMEVKDLRRVSRLTNRYVPSFRGREIDDPRPPVRVFPIIDPLVAAPEEGGSEGAGGYNPDYGLSSDGWSTLGTSGA